MHQLNAAVRTQDAKTGELLLSYLITSYTRLFRFTMTPLLPMSFVVATLHTVTNTIGTIHFVMICTPALLLLHFFVSCISRYLLYRLHIRTCHLVPYTPLLMINIRTRSSA